MYFKKNNLLIYYEKFGESKKTILILPGWGNTSSTFKNIINYFKEKYTIYIIDYPGFGNSPIPKEELSIYDYAEAILSFIRISKNQIQTKPYNYSPFFWRKNNCLIIRKI